MLFISHLKFLLSQVCSACSCLYHTAFFNLDSKNYPIIEQDVVNRHRKEIIELLMDIYRYSRSEKPVDLLGMNACVLQIFHIMLSESMAAPYTTPDPN